MNKNKDKNVYEELEKCKQTLKILKTFYKDLIFKPEFLEEISYDLAYSSLPLDETEVEEEKVDECREKILDALNDLLLKHNFIFPFRDTLEKYVSDKDRLYPEEYLNKLEKLRIVSLWNHNIEVDEDFKKKMKKELKKGEDGEPLKNINLPRPPTVLGKFELNILDVHYTYSSSLIDDGISASLCRLRLMPLALRTALEIAVNGFFYEHIIHPFYEKTIPRTSNRKKDSVLEFIKIIKDKEKELNLDKATILLNIEKYGIWAPKFSDVVYWLDKWKVFSPIINANDFLMSRWKSLSEAIHGRLSSLALKMAETSIPQYFIKELTYVADVTMLGTLNTIRNLRYNKIKLFSEQEFWKELEERTQKAELVFTSYRLQNMLIND